MKTEDLIRNTALKLFNSKGCSSITLRDIAADMKKSYGNITYHFKRKNELILALYEDMAVELSAVLDRKATGDGLLEELLKAPEITWKISVKYQFLYREYAWLICQYPDLHKRLKASGSLRMQSYLKLFRQLQTCGLMDGSLNDSDLIYLMQLSGAMRTWFFIEHPAAGLRKKGARQSYIDCINRLLYPYLSPAGKTIYKQMLTDRR